MRKYKQKGQGIQKKLDEVARVLEEMKIAEYVQYLQDTKRMLITNFMAGLARGFGMAVGFTVLGAVVLYFLGRLAESKLPLIGDFIAEIVKIVRENL